MAGKASALIYTREKYIGFPGGWFKVQPEGFPEEIAKKILETYAMNAMEDVKSLRSAHKQVYTVIAEGGYVVLGMAAYLRDLFSDGWEAADEKNRPIYGFLGYVWKQETFSQPVCFPGVKAYADLISEHIRPNWEVSRNAHWAVRQELVPYQYAPSMPRNENISEFVPNRIETAENAEQLLQWAIQKAADGENVSVCTNVTVYDSKDYKTPYRYIATAAAGRLSRKSEITAVTEPSKVEETKEGGVSLIPNQIRNRTGTNLERKSLMGKAVAIALLASGAALLILAVISIPMAWMTGLLWKLLLVAAIACLAAGTVNLFRAQKKPKPGQGITIDTSAQISRRKPVAKIDTPAFKTAEKPEIESVRSAVKPALKSPKAKRPEDETTEDLFKF